MPLENGLDPLSLLPTWVAKEKDLAHMLPYVSLVNDQTIRTRGNELFQCIRLGGINSFTKDDEELDKVRRLFAAIVAQIGQDFAFYVHKVSKAIDHNLPPVEGDDFAAAVDAKWRASLEGYGMRDKTLTLTVINRPPAGSKIPFKRKKSIEQLAKRTEKRLRALGEVVGFIRSTFADMSPRLLEASNGELLGFLGGLNTGQELPLYQGSKYGYLSQDVANTRVTFKGANFELSDGNAGKRLGTTFAVKNYPEKTTCTMFDELNLPVDMVITHSFTPINSNIMSERIKKQQRLMRAADDGAISLLENLAFARDDLESRRLSFGDHHMTVTVFANTAADLDPDFPSSRVI